MKKLILIVSLLVLQTSVASAYNLRSFLKSCAYGTLGGAAAGVVSMAFTDKPGESWSNVAKGASLGLYAGIAFGAFQANQTPTAYQQPDFAIMPSFHEGQVDGVRVTTALWTF